MLNEITVAVFLACGFGLVAYGLNQLLQQDRQTVLDNKCPPHKWESQYKIVAGVGNAEPMYDGLKCSKCGRRPGDFSGPRSLIPKDWAT